MGNPTFSNFFRYIFKNGWMFPIAILVFTKELNGWLKKIFAVSTRPAVVPSMASMAPCPVWNGFLLVGLGTSAESRSFQRPPTFNMKKTRACNLNKISFETYTSKHSNTPKAACPVNWLYGFPALWHRCCSS